jgi:molecular chaperone DnaK
MSNNSRAIGIDLGTTNSCVAVIENGDPVVIPNDEGFRTTPSVVGFSPNGDRLVGQIAWRQAVTNPERTIYAAKRLIGRKVDDKEVRHSRDLMPYEIVPHDNGDAWIEIDGEIMPPTQVSAVILDRMKTIAEAYLGEDVTEAVITVPAYFNDAQRQATKDAGRIAGLDVKRIINEPTAAALAYGLGRNEHEKIAVFDLGGGTFDISILELDSGVFQVKATNGDTFLGGEDFDNRLINKLLDNFEAEHGVDLREAKGAMQRVKEAAEEAKKKLSSTMETEISLPFIAHGSDMKPLHLESTLNREELESLVADLIDRLAIPCEACMSDAGIGPDGLDAILLVGGMTRMPRVQEKVIEIFGKEPEKGLNPDEVVAVGAAIQASVLKGEVKDILLVDVTPLTLGIEISGGILEPIIPRNTSIPCRKSKVFTTAMDNQDMVRVHILQGEREMADDNKSLGTLELHGLPPAPRGVPEIEVSFEIDADGIMKAAAKDMATGKKQDLRIVPTSGLSDDEIQNMVSSREQYRGDDQKRREIAEAKNHLDSLIYSTARNFEDFGDLLTDDDEEAIQQALDDAEDALESGDLDVVQEAHDALYEAAQRLGTAIYQQGNQDTDEDGDELEDIDDLLEDDLLGDFDIDEDTFDSEDSD